MTDARSIGRTGRSLEPTDRAVGPTVGLLAPSSGDEPKPLCFAPRFSR